MFNSNKRVIMYVAIGLVLWVIVITIIINTLRGNKNPVTPTPTPTISQRPAQITSSPTPTLPYGSLTITKRPEGGPEPGVPYSYVNPEDDKRNKAKGDLLSRIPYTGINFRLDYSYNDFKYILTMPQDKREVGNAEFDEFLSKNGFTEGRAWLPNLEVVYE